MKVGIIGGGAAGLTTAWLLDQECEVILFEQQNRLGGHAYTIMVEHNGQNIPIEIGFEFFNTWLFPNFNRLLEVLHVPIAPFALTYCFYTDKSMLALSSLQASKMIKQLFNPPLLSTLLQFNHVLRCGKKFVKTKNYTMSVEQFADSIMITTSFKDNFLYPFLTAGWGCSIDAFKLFSAYDVLSWITQKSMSLQPQEWYEIVGGISVYINALIAQLKRTLIRTASGVESLLYHQGNYIIIEQNGRKTEVDHVVIATSPQQAALLLKNTILHEDMCKKLLWYESFPAVVAVHGDPRFMPQKQRNWSVANVNYDGVHSALTIYKPWKSEQLFRSWLPGNEPPMPESLYALEHFHHQKVLPRYFEAQHYLKSVLGKNNLWLAGCYMDHLDSHESAVSSALNIAKKLVPQAKRLQYFKNIISS